VPQSLLVSMSIRGARENDKHLQPLEIDQLLSELTSKFEDETGIQEKAIFHQEKSRYHCSKEILKSKASQETKEAILLRMTEMKKEGSPKRSLELDFQKSFENQDLRWNLGNFPYVIGHIDEYEEEEILSCGLDIFIHNNVIYYTKGDTPLHADTVYYLQKTIDSALVRSGLAGLDRAAAGRSFLLMNLLGCHSKFGKVPDAGFVIDSRIASRLRYPVLVSEVAVMNEDLDTLFSEGAAWLSEATPVRYFLGYYFTIQAEFNMRIILLKRITPPRRFTTEAERESNFSQLIQENRSREDRRCLEHKDDSEIGKLKKRPLGNRYQVRVLRNETYGEQHFFNCQFQGQPLVFNFSTRVLIEGTGNPFLTQYQTFTSLIHERIFFNVIYSSFHETYEEYQMAQN
jgi:hypothetical protein